MKRTLSIFICILTLFTNAAEITGTVTKVLDGDTILVKEDSTTVIPTENKNTFIIQRGTFKVRLADIDAPELKQEFGEKSKEALQILIDSKKVKVIFHQIDIYGRVIGTVYLINNILGIDLTQNKSINEQMVKYGWAWWYNDYSKKFWFKKLELEAKEFKLGIWENNNNIAPWDFRKNNKKVKSNNE